MEPIILQTTAEDKGLRLDAFLASRLEEVTRSAAQRLIEEGRVSVNGKAAAKSCRLTGQELVEVELSEPEAIEAVPENIPLDVVYEDDDVIVVNKPVGLVVHPAPGHPDGTLVNALLYHCGDSLSGIGGQLRPGIVHRLDMDTSGLIIAAKNDFAHQSLSAQLADRSLSRVYEAVVRGSFREDSGTVDAPIGRHPADRKRMAVTERNSRHAVTHWEVIARYEGWSHIRCILQTGRTHQIRVHMAHLGHPLLGDTLYGGKADKGQSTQCLHARRLKFVHPRTGESIALESPLPDYFQSALSRLGSPRTEN